MLTAKCSASHQLRWLQTHQGVVIVDQMFGYRCMTGVTMADQRCRLQIHYGVIIVQRFELAQRGLAIEHADVLRLNGREAAYGPA